MSLLKAISVGTALKDLLAGSAYAKNIRIAHIDPFSGNAFSTVEKANKSLRLVVEIANRDKWAEAKIFEVINFDGTGSTQESGMTSGLWGRPRVFSSRRLDQGRRG